MRKIIDQNGRLFGLISILDVAVLLLVGLLAAAFFVKQDVVSPASQSSTSGVTVTYQLFANDLEDVLVPTIVVGDKLFDHDQDTGGSIGVITDIQVNPATKTVYLPDGTADTALLSNYSDVIITVEGTCDIVEGHYRFNSIYEIGVNANRNFYTPFVGFTGTVISID